LNKKSTRVASGEFVSVSFSSSRIKDTDMLYFQMSATSAQCTPTRDTEESGSISLSEFQNQDPLT
ncbi:hypothetical protein CEXT_195651, partial [Caerostris extrusa]